ncbi:unnamed protein product [Coccothraustes coccothraustes]
MAASPAARLSVERPLPAGVARCRPGPQRFVGSVVPEGGGSGGSGGSGRSARPRSESRQRGARAAADSPARQRPPLPAANQSGALLTTANQSAPLPPLANEGAALAPAAARAV